MKKIFTVVSVGFDPEGYILDKLFEKDVITAQQVQEIEAIPENGGRAKKLLYLLYSEISHPEAFIVLREALKEEYGWLVQQIDGMEMISNIAMYITRIISYYLRRGRLEP